VEVMAVLVVLLVLSHGSVVSNGSNGVMAALLVIE
jgi:hypothetical protein